MDAAITELQRGFLDDAQIASSRAIIGIDTQLIDDGTYFVVESNGEVAGCGGWSRRATLYGGNQAPGRDAKLLDPALDPARVRAMYTNPAHARRGVARQILSPRWPPCGWRRTCLDSFAWRRWWIGRAQRTRRC